MNTYGEVPLGVECAWPSLVQAERQSVLPVDPAKASDEAPASPSAPLPER